MQPRTATISIALAGSVLAACTPAVHHPPAPEFGVYALGMTLTEALDAAGTGADDRSSWPDWPPTSVSVPPSPGSERMRLLLAGDCVAAIEALYPDACEDGLTQRLAQRYGAPPELSEGTSRWNDGTREVTLETQPRDGSACGPGCRPTCTMRYRLAEHGLALGTPSTSQGIAACRAYAGRHRTRFAPGVLHGLQRHTLDALAAILHTN